MTAIDFAVTIRGVGQALTTIDAAGASAALTVGATGVLTLEDLTITGGVSPSGGGIASDGDLTVRHVRFMDNTSENDGGAIFHTGAALVIEDSLFQGNQADHGGGVFAEVGTVVTVLRSTFDGNSCGQVTGCGLYVQGSGTVTSSLFVSPADDHDSIYMGGGTISASSIGLDGGLAGTADASENWWGMEAGPVADVDYGAGITVDSYLSSVALAVTPNATPSVGSAVTVTATVRDGDGATVVLPVTYAVSGTHAGTSTSSAGGHTYTGTSAGGDTVQASVVFGDGSEAPMVPLSASVPVTWNTAGAPPVVDPATPTPVPTLTAEQKFDALAEAGLFDTGGDQEGLQDDLDRAQIANAAGLDSLDLGTGSTVSSFDAPPPPWQPDHDELAQQQGHEPTGANPFDPNLSIIGFPNLSNIINSMLGVLANFLSTISDSLASWGFFTDFTGTILNFISRVLSGLGFPVSLSVVDQAVAPSTLSTNGNVPTLLRLEVVPGDLPAGTTPEEVVLVRLDPKVPAWVEIESVVTQLADGTFAITAYVDQTALHTVMARPLEDEPLASGLTVILWRGADGQPPARALRSADAPIEAIFSLDPVTQRWSVYRPGAPAFVQTLTAMEDGSGLVVLTSGAGTWRLPAR